MINICDHIYKNRKYEYSHVAQNNIIRYFDNRLLIYLKDSLYISNDTSNTVLLFNDFSKLEDISLENYKYPLNISLSNNQISQNLIMMHENNNFYKSNYNSIRNADAYQVFNLRSQNTQGLLFKKYGDSYYSNHYAINYYDIASIIPPIIKLNEFEKIRLKRRNYLRSANRHFKDPYDALNKFNEK